MRLSYARRKRLPKREFVFPEGTDARPGHKAFPIDTLARARNALSRIGQSAVHLTRAERERVRRAVCAKYPEVGQCAVGLGSLGFTPDRHAMRAVKSLDIATKQLSAAKSKIERGLCAAALPALVMGASAAGMAGAELDAMEDSRESVEPTNRMLDLFNELQELQQDYMAACVVRR